MTYSVQIQGDASHPDPVKEKELEAQVIHHVKNHVRHHHHGVTHASGSFKHHGHVNLHEPAPLGAPGAPVT